MCDRADHMNTSIKEFVGSQLLAGGGLWDILHYGGKTTYLTARPEW